MRKLTLLVLVVIFLNACSQPKKCRDFKVGEFRYENPSFKDWKIIRTENRQVEIDEVRKIKIESSIRWISDCEYHLTHIKVNDSKDSPIVGETVKVKIIEVNENRVICEAEGLGRKLELEMVLVE